MNAPFEFLSADEAPITPAPDAAAWGGDGDQQQAHPTLDDVLIANLDTYTGAMRHGARMVGGREVQREVVYGSYCADGETYVEVQVSPGTDAWRIAISDAQDDVSPDYARTLIAVLLCAADEADALNDEIAAREAAREAEQNDEIARQMMEAADAFGRGMETRQADGYGVVA